MQNNIVVDICNEAIMATGQDTTITSLSENSNLADLCNRLWNPTLSELYSTHPWAFKKCRGVADLETTDPTMNVFAYPNNALRILGFYKDAGYQVPEKLARVGSDKDGNRKIYSPYAPLFIEFLTSAAPNDALQPWLRSCMVYLLASKIAQAKGKSNTELLQMYQFWLDRAEENNATEDSATFTADDRYINCR